MDRKGVVVAKQTLDIDAPSRLRKVSRYGDAVDRQRQDSTDCANTTRTLTIVPEDDVDARSQSLWLCKNAYVSRAKLGLS